MERIFLKLKRKITENPIESIFFFYLYLSQFYYSYRYIFKINSSSTSPSYSDGGLFEKVLKYIITALLYVLLFVILLVYRKKWANIRFFLTNKKNKYIFLSLFLFLLYIILNLFFVHGVNFLSVTSSVSLEFIIKFLFFIPILFFIPFLFSNKKFYANWKLFLYFSLIFNFLYDCIQLILFALYNRLPALAYMNGSVRFGGAWDDPNGISLFLILVLCFLLFDSFQKRLYQYLLLFISIFCLYLALSFTAFFLVFILMLIILFYRKYKETLFILGSICLLFIGSYFIPHYYENNFLLKLPSASQHIFEVFHVQNPFLSKNIKLSDGQIITPVPLPSPTPTLTIKKKDDGKVVHQLVQHSDYSVQIVNPQKSIVSGFEDASLSSVKNITEHLIGYDTIIFSENFYKQLIHNFGYVVAVLLIIPFCLLFWKSSRLWKNSLYAPLSIFIFLTLIGNLGLPYFEMYPINMYFWICVSFLLLKIDDTPFN